MSAAATFVFSIKDSSWVQDNLEQLSSLHTDAMAECWDEHWSNDLSETDVRCGSPALMRYYINMDAIFFCAEDSEKEIAGYSILSPISATYLDKHGKNGEWADTSTWLNAQNTQLPYTLDATPGAGDVELAIFISCKRYRGQGIFKRLSEMSLKYIDETLSKGKRAWLQTLQRPQIKVVEGFYLNNGFETLARTRIKETERIILSKEL